MEKNCKNCFNYNFSGLSGMDSCSLDWGNYALDEPICHNLSHWKPNYQTLEAQLSKANALIIEQIEQINRVEIELKQYKEALRLAVYDILAVKFNGFDEVDLNNVIERYLDKTKREEK